MSFLDLSSVGEVYLACGYTDMRKSIDGLSAIVEQQFQMDPFSRALFLFCGRRADSITVKDYIIYNKLSSQITKNTS